jgi:hypothetical protein
MRSPAMAQRLAFFPAPARQGNTKRNLEIYDVSQVTFKTGVTDLTYL